MDRRKFLTYVGCGCGSLLLHSCSTAPITDRKQLKIIPEAKLNAQAAQIYEKVKEKEKMSNDLKSLKLISSGTDDLQNSTYLGPDSSNLFAFPISTDGNEVIFSLRMFSIIISIFLSIFTPLLSKIFIPLS